MSTASVEQLRAIDLFSELDDEQLGRWAAVAELRDLPAGAVLTEAGEPSPGLHLLLDGTVLVFVPDGDRMEPAGENFAPTWIGAIATLVDGPSGVRMQAGGAVRVATVPPDEFAELVIAHRTVFQRVMQQVRPVMGRITAMEQNRERLAALGTMAAGLAHELNNPAAAARRSSSALADALEVLGSTIGVFVESGVERAEAEELVALHGAALARAADRAPVGALDAADAEDELADALTDLGVPESWTLTEPLAAAGVDREWLERVVALAGPAAPAAIRWVAASITARELAAELAESTDRMSALVGAVKTYAYMDRGTLIEADVHEGLETTLTILGHKLKHTAIEVVRDYDRTLPALTVRGSELNQVWTNLLDNAIDALGERGTITITTRRDGDCAVIEIADDGPGIPAELRDRVFEPFFTTKDVGRGTGLGLDTARKIVTERHRGSLTVDSVPGRTLFSIWLPIEHTTS